MEAECQEVQDQLLQLQLSRDALQSEFSQLTDSNRKLWKQIYEDDIESEGQLHVYQTEKQRLESKLEDLEKLLKEKDKKITDLDAKASEYLLQVTTTSNTLFDGEEEEDDETAAQKAAMLLKKYDAYAESGSETPCESSESEEENSQSYLAPKYTNDKYKIVDVLPTPGIKKLNDNSVSETAETEQDPISLESESMDNLDNDDDLEDEFIDTGGFNVANINIDGKKPAKEKHQAAQESLKLEESQDKKEKITETCVNGNISSMESLENKLSQGDLLSLSSLLSELKQVKDDMGKCMTNKGTDIVDLDDKLTTTNKEVISLRDSLFELTSNLQEKERNYQNLMHDNFKAKVELEKKQVELDQINTSLSLLKEEKGENFNKMQALEEMTADYRKEIENFVADRSQTEDEIEGAAALSDASSDEDIYQSNNTLLPDIIRVEGKVKKLEKEKKLYSQKLKASNKHLKALAKEREHKQKECEMLQKKVETVENKMCELQGTFDALVKAILGERDQLLAEVKERNSQIEELNNNIKVTHENHRIYVEKFNTEKKILEKENQDLRSGQAQIDSLDLSKVAAYQDLSDENIVLKCQLEDQNDTIQELQQKLSNIPDIAEELLKSEQYVSVKQENELLQEKTNQLTNEISTLNLKISEISSSPVNILENENYTKLLKENERLNNIVNEKLGDSAISLINIEESDAYRQLLKENEELKALKSIPCEKCKNVTCQADLQPQEPSQLAPVEIATTDAPPLPSSDRPDIIPTESAPIINSQGLEVLNAQLQEKENENTKLKTQITSIQGEMANFVSYLKGDMTTLKSEIDKANNEKQNVEQALVDLQKEHAEIVDRNQELEKIQAEFDVVDKSRLDNIELLKTQVQDLQLQSDDLNNKIFALNSEMIMKEDEFKEELSAREGSINELQTTVTKNQKQSKENYHALQDDMAALQMRLGKDLEDAHNLAKNWEAKCKSVEDEAKKESQDLKDRIMLLEEDIKNLSQKAAQNTLPELELESEEENPECADFTCQATEESQESEIIKHPPKEPEKTEDANVSEAIEENKEKTDTESKSPSADLSSNNPELQQKLIEKTNEVEELKTKINTLQFETSTFVAYLNSEISTLKSEMMKKNEEMDAAVQTRSMLEINVKELQSINEELRIQVGNLETENTKLTASLNSIQKLEASETKSNDLSSPPDADPTKSMSTDALNAPNTTKEGNNATQSDGSKPLDILDKIKFIDEEVFASEEEFQKAMQLKEVKIKDLEGKVDVLEKSLVNKSDYISELEKKIVISTETPTDGKEPVNHLIEIEKLGNEINDLKKGLEISHLQCSNLQTTISDLEREKTRLETEQAELKSILACSDKAKTITLEIESEETVVEHIEPANDKGKEKEIKTHTFESHQVTLETDSEPSSSSEEKKNFDFPKLETVCEVVEDSGVKSRVVSVSKENDSKLLALETKYLNKVSDIKFDIDKLMNEYISGDNKDIEQEKVLLKRTVKLLEEKLLSIFIDQGKYEEEKANLKASYEEKQNKSLEMQNEMVNDLERLILTLESEKKELEHSINDLKTSNEDMSGQVADFEKKFFILDNRIISLGREKDHLKEENNKLRTVIDNGSDSSKEEGGNNLKLMDDLITQVRDLQIKLDETQSSLDQQEKIYEERLSVITKEHEDKIASLRNDMTEEIDLIEQTKDDTTQDFEDKISQLQLSYEDQIKNFQEECEIKLSEEKAQFGRVLVTKIDEYEKKLAEKKDEVAGYQIRLESLQKDFEDKISTIGELELNLSDLSYSRVQLEKEISTLKSNLPKVKKNEVSLDKETATKSKKKIAPAEVSSVNFNETGAKPKKKDQYVPESQPKKSSVSEKLPDTISAFHSNSLNSSRENLTEHIKKHSSVLYPSPPEMTYWPFPTSTQAAVSPDVTVSGRSTPTGSLSRSSSNSKLPTSPIMRRKT